MRNPHNGYGGSRIQQRGWMSNRNHLQKMTEAELLAQIQTLAKVHAVLGNEQLQALKKYFAHYSIHEYSNKEDILQQIYTWIESTEPAQSKLGLACFIAILCQCRSAFSADFSKQILEKISPCLQSSDNELFLMSLHIAVHISGTTLDQTRLVQSVIPMTMLVDFILQPHLSSSIIHKALYLFGNYCRASDTISYELADFMCQVICHVLDTSGNVYEMVRESIWLCSILIQHHRRWVEPVSRFNLAARFNDMLIATGTPVRCCLLSLIGEMSASSSILVTINLDLVVEFIGSETSRIDVHAIACLKRCIENHPDSINRMMDAGLVEKLVKCVKNGSCDGRIQAIGFLADLSLADNFPLLDIVTNFSLLDDVVDFVRDVGERSGLTVLRLVRRCVDIASASGNLEALVGYFESTSVRDELEDTADDPRPLIANTVRGILADLGWAYA
jgi:hypothetical protein